VLCTIRGRSQHKMHIGDSATQFQAGDFLGKSWSDAEKRSWINNIRDCFVSLCHQVFPVQNCQERPDQLLHSLRYSVHTQVRATLSQMRSNKTCFACLQAVPDHVLPCGHALCPTCIQEIAKPSRFVECAFDVPSCIICGKHNIHQVQLKPKCAGVRILTLDGGGVRGVVELALLSRIQTEVGLEISIREMFDLVVGTSTGGIVALGVVMKNISLKSMTKFFEEAAESTFGHPNGGAEWVAKGGMLFKSYPSIYPDTRLKQHLQRFFGMTPLFAPATSGTFQSTTRVAVTTAKDGPDGGSTQCLIANYNRPRGDWAYFEREDDASRDMAIWEAALATSAAPIYLPTFRKDTTNYVDGAMYANCPVRLALEEKDRIWHHDGASLDVLVSLGTGRQEKKWKPPKILSYSFFRPMIKSFEEQMNSTVNWEKVQSASSALAKARLYRLNPRVRGKSGGYVDLDDHQDMAFLRSGIEDGALLQPDEETTIQRVARTLLAHLFFFEPDEQHPRPGALHGSIRCRLPHETQATIALLRDKVMGFYSTLATKEEAATVASIPSGRWEPLHGASGHAKPSEMIHEEIFEDGSSIKKFRLDCTLGSDVMEIRPYSILAVRLVGVDETLPISGFPATVTDLRERWATRWV